MTEVVCFDASVWVKVLVEEEMSDEAAALVEQSVGGRLVAPAFCWAEVGSIIRKKLRQRQIDAAEATAAWAEFRAMPITFMDTAAIQDRAWMLAGSLGQPTLYDAAYLACVELAEGSSRAFWTADSALIRALGKSRPAYLHELTELC